MKLTPPMTRAAALWLVATAACAGGSPTDSGAETSLFALVETIDGAYLYPPLANAPSFSGAFDASHLQALRVLLESTDAAGAVSEIAAFDASTRPALLLMPQFEVYFVNVPAAAYFTDPSRAYRFRVLLADREIARSDLSNHVFEVLTKNPGLLIGVKVRLEVRPAPTLASTPPSPVRAGAPGATVILSGSGFQRDTQVFVDGQSVATTWSSSTELSIELPAASIAAPGDLSIRVETQTPGGGSATTTLRVEADTPIVSELGTTTAIAGDPDLELAVFGAGFLPGATATFGGHAVTTTVVHGGLLTVSVPAALLAQAGIFDVVVSNPEPSAGPALAVPFTVLNPVPVLTSVTPESATLTIAGSAFVAGATVTFDGVPLATVAGAEGVLIATVPGALSTAGRHDVVVSNPEPAAGVSAALSVVVENARPTIASASLTSLVAGSPDTTITLTGEGFAPGARVFADGRELVTTYLSSTALSAVVPESSLATAGSVELTVANPEPSAGPSAPLSLAIINPRPTLAGITPTTLTSGPNDATITVTGSAFAPGATVTAGGVALVTTWTTATTLTAVVPAALLAAPGSLTLTVANPAPSEGVSAPLTVAVLQGAPVLTSISPASYALPEMIEANPSLTVTLNGQGFQRGDQLFIWGAARLAATFVSSTRLVATVPGAYLGYGSRTYHVETPATGVRSNGLAFDVLTPRPTITSLSPSPGGTVLLAGMDNTVTISGGLFYHSTPSGPGDIRVRVGATALPVRLLPTSDNWGRVRYDLRIEVVVPSSIIAGSALSFTVDNGAPSVGPSNTVSLPVQNPAPTFSGYATGSPVMAIAGDDPATITIQGTGFNAGTSVTFGGAPLTATFVSSTQLTAQLSASALASAGTFDVTVTNPAPGGGSASQTFTVLAKTFDREYAIGPSSTCRRSSDGSWRCVGAYSNIGHGGPGGSNRHEVADVQPQFQGAIQLELAADNACMMFATGEIRCSNGTPFSNASFGTGSGVFSWSPWTKFDLTYAGGLCAMTRLGDVYCWNVSGTNTSNGVSHFQGATDLVAGYDYACAIGLVGYVGFPNLAYPAVYCWGDNQFGQLGIGRLTAAGNYARDLMLVSDGQLERPTYGVGRVIPGATSTYFLGDGVSPTFVGQHDVFHTGKSCGAAAGNADRLVAVHLPLFETTSSGPNRSTAGHSHFLSIADDGT
ncbi:IPT/TIG domain-containing protein, partial [Myxococcota bacterium]|nr:IPT/TIG domain-containing protein [Myxococcota bacterium]